MVFFVVVWSFLFLFFFCEFGWESMVQIPGPFCVVFLVCSVFALIWRTWGDASPHCVGFYLA